MSGEKRVAGSNASDSVNRPCLLGEEAPPKISVSGFNNGPTVSVDVHVGVFSPDGIPYEFSDWNTNFQPFLPGFSVPAGASIPATQLVDLGTFPGGMAPGIWTAAAAITEPGTLNVIAMQVVPFSALESVSGGTQYGALALIHSQSSLGVDVDASGVFLAASTSLGSLIDT